MRIVFADDHFLVRVTLNRLLRKLGTEDAPVHIDEETSLDGVFAQLITTPPPDLIILDLSMPGMNGPAGIAEVRARTGSIPIIVLSGYSDRATILSCFKFGASGFIPKTTGQSEMLAALRLVMDGQRYIPPTLLDQELTPDLPPATGAPAAGAPASVGTQSDLASLLTPREHALLKALAEGKKNKEIARALGLEEVTIKFALRRLYKKMDATNRASAVSLAVKAGLV